MWTRPIAGTGLKVEIRIGDVEAILFYVIRRFHYEAEQIQRVDLAGSLPRTLGISAGMSRMGLLS